MHLLEDVHGSFRSIGAQIGEATKADLPFVRDKTIEFLLENAAVSGLPRMREIAGRYLASTEGIFPEALEYMGGLADAGGLAFEDAALIAFSEEILAEFEGAAPEKCSTAAVRSPRGWVIVHNEDYEPQYLGKMVALEMEPAGFSRVACLTYPGHFPCLAGSLNARGVAITNNSLWPEARPGLSKNVLHFRAALSQDMDEAIGWLGRQPAALTGHYTVAWGEGDDLVGLEVSNRLVARTVCVAFDPGGEPYWHANHARFLDLRAADPAVVAKKHTLVRGEKLEKLLMAGARAPDPDALIAIFSTNDGVLHRTPEQNPTSVTLATVVIRPATGELWIQDAWPRAAIRNATFSLGPNGRN